MDLISLYRGEPFFGPSKMISKQSNLLGMSADDLSKLSGQYFTTNPSLASDYAGKTGIIKSMKVPSSYLDKFNRFEKMVTNLPSGKYTYAGVADDAFLVPKSTIKNYPSKIDFSKTLSNYLINSKLGETYRMLEPNLGDDYTKLEKTLQLGKNVGNMGLGFLKQNALRTLAMLGTLPAQAGLMTLTPTRMGNAELPQMPKGPPSIINQGGGGSFDTSRGDKAGTSLGSGQFSPKTSRGRSGYGIGGLV
jgi:hypothetical protein